MHAAAFYLILVLVSTGLHSAQEKFNGAQDMSSQHAPDVIMEIKNGLASKESSRQDSAITLLCMLINNAAKSPKENEAVLGLARDKVMIKYASDIVAARQAGWYEERDAGQDRYMPFFYPLIYLLSVSPFKTAGITLVTAMPAAGFDVFFRKSVRTHELALKSALPKLMSIDNKLCCYYPGKDAVSIMQSIDFRIAMLKTYLEAANENGMDNLTDNVEMKKFLSGCLIFGDENKGRIIRSLAVELAGKLIKAGIKDFLPALNKIALTDPYYSFRLETGAGKYLPYYNTKSKHYPVREKAAQAIQ